MSPDPNEKSRRAKAAMEPTLPATGLKAGLPDLASERRADEDRSGGSMPWVVVGLVACVAVAFWWLSGRAPKTAPPAAPAVAAPPTVAAPAKPTKPTATTVAAPGKPLTPAPAAPPLPPATASPAPAVATAPSLQKHHHHKKQAKKQKPVKLPRLPSPPPDSP
jgi:hypothetical protein